MDLQPWSPQFELHKPTKLSTSGGLGNRPAHVNTRGTGEYQSTQGMIGLKAGNRRGTDFAAIITDGVTHHVQVKGNATVIINRQNQIHVEVDSHNYAEFNPTNENLRSGARFKRLVKAFDDFISFRPTTTEIRACPPSPPLGKAKLKRKRDFFKP